MTPHLSRCLPGNCLSHPDTLSSAQVCESFLEKSNFLLGDADGEKFQRLLRCSLSTSLSPLKSSNLSSSPESGLSTNLKHDY